MLCLQKSGKIGEHGGSGYCGIELVPKRYIYGFRVKIIAKYETEQKKSATKNSLKESGF